MKETQLEGFGRTGKRKKKKKTSILSGEPQTATHKSTTSAHTNNTQTHTRAIFNLQSYPPAPPTRKEEVRRAGSPKFRPASGAKSWMTRRRLFCPEANQPELLAALMNHRGSGGVGRGGRAAPRLAASPPPGSERDGNSVRVLRLLFGLPECVSSCAGALGR